MVLKGQENIPRELSYCSKVRAAEPSTGDLQGCFFPLDDSIPKLLCGLALVKRQKLVTVSKSSYSGISLFSFLVHAHSSGKTEEGETGREKSSSHVLLLTCIPHG